MRSAEPDTALRTAEQAGCSTGEIDDDPNPGLNRQSNEELTNDRADRRIDAGK